MSPEQDTLTNHAAPLTSPSQTTQGSMIYLHSRLPFSEEICAKVKASGAP